MILCFGPSWVFISCGGGGGKAGGSQSGNPVPSINFLAPISAPVGSGAFHLTINGSGIVSGSVAQWNGSDRVTTFNSSTQLSAEITAADTSTMRQARVMVFNPVPGGGMSGAVSFSIYKPLPVISRLSPSNRTAGSSDFTLTASGLNFLPSSIVRWNSSNRPTTFVNSTQLTAAIKIV
jgi:hypothetical protein